MLFAPSLRVHPISGKLYRQMFGCATCCRPSCANWKLTTLRRIQVTLTIPLRSPRRFKSSVVIIISISTISIRLHRWKHSAIPPIDRCYRSVVCPSVCLYVRLLHSCSLQSRWTAWDGRDTRVIRSTTVLDGASGAPQQGRICRVGIPSQYLHWKLRPKSYR